MCFIRPPGIGILSLLLLLLVHALAAYYDHC